MSTIAALAAALALLTGVAVAMAAEGSGRSGDRGASRGAAPLVDLRAKHAREQERAREARRQAAQTGPIQGVPRSTLDAIAARESGGDPRAVNSAGYYGKYQFSVGTWQAVGGKGNPAEASEAEQDLRAAILYNRSGPGQWPVCGV